MLPIQPDLFREDIKDQLLELAVRGRTLAELRLISSEERSIILMNLIGHIPFTADQTGSLVSVGSGWEARTGRLATSAHYQGWMLFLHQDDLTDTRVRWNAAIESQSPIDTDFRLRQHGGDYRWYKARAAPQYHTVEGETLWHGTFEDVNGRYLAEIEYARTQSALMYLSHLSAMGIMASTLAHELNQPLTAITNFLRAGRLFVERGDGVDDITSALLGADKAAVRAGEIVRRVRELVVSGQAEKRPEIAGTVVNEAVELLSHEIRTLNISVDIDIDSDFPVIMVDRIQIQQVILNLVRNAIEAVSGMDERRINIRITIFSSDYCAISVRDSGPGIPRIIAARLFELFNTSKTTGSGIGLSICRTIVEAHGGSIWHTERYQGTEMVFTVPIAI